MTRNRWIQLGLLAFLGSGLVACGSEGGPGVPGSTPEAFPPTGYAHQRETEAVDLYWNCTQPAPDRLLLQGVAVNSVAPEVRYLELTVVGVDAHGATVSEATGAARKSVIGTRQSAPIEMELRTTGREVRFDLFFQYQAPGQSGGEKSELPAGAPEVRLVATHPFLLAQTLTRLMLRDICPEARRRAP